MDNSEDFEDLPPEIIDAVKEATNTLVPQKSEERYKKEFRLFEDWCNQTKVSNIKEEVMLAYFHKSSKTYAPSTLWSKYSMLKLVIKLEKDIDISKYYKLTSYLKRANDGYKSKKSMVLEQKDAENFIFNAPDNIYLMTKVATIFGLAGACRREELMKITTDDIEDNGNILIVTIPCTKTNKPRKFVVCDPGEDKPSYIDLYQKYKALRPKNCQHKRFFLYYKNGKCTSQNVGINTFGKMPCNIAGYLGLKNPELYTGHCFRRSSATLLANSGCNITNIKRHGGWKSTSVAESYVEESIENKRKIAENILKTPSNAVVTSKMQESSCSQSFPIEKPSSSTQVAFSTSALAAVPMLPEAVQPNLPSSIHYTSNSQQQTNQGISVVGQIPTNQIQVRKDVLQDVAASAILQRATNTNCTFNFNFYNR